MMINKRLINLCGKSKKYIGFTILVNLISTLCNIGIILTLGNFINKIYFREITSLSDKLIFKVGILIILLLVVRFICSILSSRFSNLASSEARTTLRELIYKKLLKIGTGYNKEESTSSIVQVMVEGVEQLEIYFGKYLPQFVYALLIPVILFITISFISFKSALVFILCVPLIPISIIAIMKIAKRILKDYWKSYSNLGGTFLDNLQGLTTLKVFNADEDRQEKMNIEAENFRKITMKVLSMQLNSITIMDLVAFGGSAFGTIVALYQFKNGILNIGDLFIIILLSSEFFIPLRLLGSYFHIAMNGMAASDRIFRILDSTERKNLNNEEAKEIKDEITVKLKNVSFSYDGERKVINNVNMNITPKGMIAIVGESGSGKSTIASLILNNHKVTEGEIEINKDNIEDLTLDTIYENIGLISTNSYIFNGNILDNLLMGKPSATEEEIFEALKIARLDEFVKGLKEGLNTKVGEGGNFLSGGQKQRLALARAILADRKMIIFDEATSNIDVESEEAIWETIYDLSKEKTILVISHRLANVKDAKKIYVMNKGELLEEGTHKELMELKGYYEKMVESQRELEEIREVS